MPAIRPIPRKDFEKFLIYVGCEFKRQKGSHRVFTRFDLSRPIIVPNHNKEITVMVIKSNLQTLKITTEKYLEILEQI